MKIKKKKKIKAENYKSTQNEPIAGEGINM
jgi:hypothetical protein